MHHAIHVQTSIQIQLRYNVVKNTMVKHYMLDPIKHMRLLEYTLLHFLKGA